MRKTLKRMAALHAAALLTLLALLPEPSWSAQPVDRHIEKLKAVVLLPLTQAQLGVDRVLLIENRGVVFESSQAEQVDAFPGQFASLDARAFAGGLLLATQDAKRQQVMVASLDASRSPVVQQTWLPKRPFFVEGLCLYQDRGGNSFVFLLGEEGQGEQWLVAHAQQPLPQAKKVRDLSLPPASEYCQVDDASETLFVNEESVGVWAYAAGPEAPLHRSVAALLAPHGELGALAQGLALLPGALLVVDGESRELRLLKPDGQLLETLSLSGLSDAEGVAARLEGERARVWVVHDEGLRELTLAWTPVAPEVASSRPILTSLVETVPVESEGDAADDPAIWVSADDRLVRILGTDKKRGLEVYDLSGQRLQSLPVGRLNNVDVRSGFALGGQTVDLAVATNRDRNSLHFFSIAPDSGELKELGEWPTPARDIYGLCLYQDKAGRIDAIANDKDGRFFQYRLEARGAQVSARLVREFAVPSQPEGCVADDRSGRLFIGEEDVGVWVLSADSDQRADLRPVMQTGGMLAADVEGLALHQTEKESLLVISSQGNDSFIVLDASPPFSVRGHFEIGPNISLGIDGVSETDGIEVTARALGGPWQDGLLVVQDGRNRMPVERQNFKYVPWSAVMSVMSVLPEAAGTPSAKEQ